MRRLERYHVHRDNALKLTAQLEVDIKMDVNKMVAIFGMNSIEALWEEEGNVEEMLKGSLVSRMCGKFLDCLSEYYAASQE
jgi:hypothetical protein